MNRDDTSWNMDCLNVISVLTMSQDAKKLKKLARRFGLVEKGSEPDTVQVLQMLHEACHRNHEMAKSLGKELDNRFRSTVLRVRSLPVTEIEKIETAWPMPLLWATLTDRREEVRLYGRYLLHGTLWNALRKAADASRDSVPDLLAEIASSKDKIRTQATELTALKTDLRKKEAEAAGLRRMIEKLEEQKRGTEQATPGQGRISRESRKLRHALLKQRERASGNLEIMTQQGGLSPDEVSLKPEENASDCILSCPCEGQAGVHGCGEHCSNGGDCCRCPLEGLRIAVVGGLERMLPAYRKVVGNLGAELLFHDGEVKNGSFKLRGVVCGADIVVFITSVNSHGALKVVKAACKKNGKRFIALRETGAESLGRMLKAAAA